MHNNTNTIGLQLGNANLREVHIGVGRLMTALDDLNPGVRAASLCAAFLAICNREKIDPYDVAVATRKMLAFAKRVPGMTDFDALELYTKEEPI